MEPTRNQDTNKKKKEFESSKYHGKCKKRGAEGRGNTNEPASGRQDEGQKRLGRQGGSEKR